MLTPTVGLGLAVLCLSVTILVVISVLRRSAIARQEWELELMRRLRRQTAPDLRTAWTSADPDLRASISLTLGKLGDRDSVAFLADAIRAKLRPGDGGPWRATVAALGVARDPVALEALVEVAASVDDPDDFRTLAWAVGELSRHYLPGSDKAIDALFPRLVEVFLSSRRRSSSARTSSRTAQEGQTRRSRLKERIKSLLR